MKKSQIMDMAESGSLKYSRILIFLNKGCTQLMRAVVLDQVKHNNTGKTGLTLDGFLHRNRDKLFAGGKRHTQQEERFKSTLYPDFGIKTNIETWDLQLLAFVALKLCTSPSLKMDIARLKSIRNSLCHSSDGSICDDRYRSYMTQIKTILQRTLQTLTDQDTVHALCNMFEKLEIESCEMLKQDSKRRLMEWYQNEKKLQMDDKLDLSEGQQRIMEKLDRLLVDKNTDGNIKPETNVTIGIKNCNTETHNAVTDLFVSLFESKVEGDDALSNTLPENGLPKLEQHIRDVFDELKRKDYKLINVSYGCVILRLRCSSYERLKELWNDAIDGTLTSVFRMVEHTLRQQYPDLELDVFITNEEWWNSVYEMVDCISKDILPDDSDICTDAPSDIMKRRRTLLLDIARNCERYGPEQRELVLMLGRRGVGKHAAIHTIMKVVNGAYDSMTWVGRRNSHTKELVMYKNCGARTDLLRKSTNEDENELFRKMTPNLPHLLNFVGLDDVDTPELKEILELLIGGYIPHGTNIEALENDQHIYGVGCLKNIYNKPREQWKVTKIVFVHSCLTSPPTALIQCLMSALHSIDENSEAMKYTGAVFLLVTKYDLVDHGASYDNERLTGATNGNERLTGGMHDNARLTEKSKVLPYEKRHSNRTLTRLVETKGIYTDSSTKVYNRRGWYLTDSVYQTAISDIDDQLEQSRPISMKDFCKIEFDLAQQLNALQENRLRWTSYCSETGYDDEKIDQIALEFLKKMVEPNIQRNIPLLTRLRLKAGRGLNRIHRSVNPIRIFVIFFVIHLIVAAVIVRMSNFETRLV